MRLSTSIGASLLFLAPWFTLVVTNKEGEKTIFDTESIEKISFQEEKTGGIKKYLATPEITVTPATTGEVTISWTSVANAGQYRHQLDDNEPTLDKSTEVVLDGLEAGTHTYTVVAVPENTQSYKESLPATATFEVAAVDPSLQMPRILAGEVTSTTIPYTVSGYSGEYYVGIIPRPTEAISDKDLISYINDNPEATQRKKIKGRVTDESFTDLTPAAHYIVAAYPVGSTDKASRQFTRTYIDCTPGTKGTIFPFGVDKTSGFYDVDKVGSLEPYGWTGASGENHDGNMCWACTASGLIQWWLDDYVSKTGHEYPFVNGEAIPKESKCYSTPIMDLINNAFGYSDLGGGCHQTIMWFFAGYYDHPFLGSPSKPESANLVGAPFRSGYPYWKGGFLGMTWEEGMNYIVCNEEANNGWDWYDYTMFYHSNYSLPKDVTIDDAAKKFNLLTIDALLQGPYYICFAGHAMSCWGADYEIMADGTPRIYNLYYCENAIHRTNVHGGYQMGPVTYEPAVYPPHMAGKNVPHCANQIGGKYVILNQSGLRGWQPYF